MNTNTESRVLEAINAEPKFKKGQAVYTSWGEPVLIDEVEIDVIIGYSIGDEYFGEDELYEEPPKYEET